MIAVEQISHWAREKKHTITAVRNHRPFRHTERYQLRRLITQSNKSPTHDGPNMVEPHRAKSVSFCNEIQSTTNKPDENSGNSLIPPAQNFEKPGKIVFSLGSFNDLPKEDNMAPAPDYDQKIVVKETVAESTLPWKRTTTNDIVPCLATLVMTDDERPLMSEAPSWVNNPSYHNLKESGSPCASPQNTLTAPPERKHTPSIFEIFQQDFSSKDEATKLPASSPVHDIPIPPPWDRRTEEEPIASPVAIQNGDKTNNLLHSSHSVFPPPHHVIIPCGFQRPTTMRKSLSLPGKASSPQSPKHWQPIETIEGSIYRKCPSEAEIIFNEVVYQQDVKSRVSEWLQHTDDSDPDEYDGIEVNFASHECVTNGFEIDSGEESDIEMTYL